jgi:23S rRNA U2552 (ribose-2'-O)-methylase RlmE/FtsJ
MTYFILPNININININHFVIQTTDITNDKIFINKSLSDFLNEIKEEIKNYSTQWDVAKKYINPYEFIHTPIPHYNMAISKHKPISRAFFKLIEIYNTFSIIDKIKPSINTFHLAEGPGGFIEATAYARKNKLDNYYGMTLIDDDNKKIPGWSKANDFLNNYKNVFIERGADNTGNLFHIENYDYCVSKYRNNMDIITADGGFDFSIDYNRQEGLAVRLIFTQILYAISLQKYDGAFVLKMFDIFLKPSVDIIYLLSIFYNKIFIVKPNTSRYANSEKYIVCLNFKYTNTHYFFSKFRELIHQMNNIDFGSITISSLLNIPIHSYYKTNIREINCILGNQQIENILNTLKIIINNEKKNEKLENTKNNNIQKCIRWCVKNNMTYNTIDTDHTNIFLKKST